MAWRQVFQSRGMASPSPTRTISTLCAASQEERVDSRKARKKGSKRHRSRSRHRRRTRRRSTSESVYSTSSTSTSRRRRRRGSGRNRSHGSRSRTRSRYSANSKRGSVPPPSMSSRALPLITSTAKSQFKELLQKASASTSLPSKPTRPSPAVQISEIEQKVCAVMDEVEKCFDGCSLESLRRAEQLLRPEAEALFTAASGASAPTQITDSFKSTATRLLKLRSRIEEGQKRLQPQNSHAEDRGENQFDPAVEPGRACKSPDRSGLVKMQHEAMEMLSTSASALYEMVNIQSALMSCSTDKEAPLDKMMDSMQAFNNATDAAQEALDTAKEFLLNKVVPEDKRLKAGTTVTVDCTKRLTEQFQQLKALTEGPEVQDKIRALREAIAGRGKPE
eukprot:gnl/MRDRNA2_/MRDRNA2_112903_c0_seq1.p1 gnl/MRDRNA2_/MRDRNA2_112903_c0~~gnl/MRDRNA2_/MRDRNA2_112903_c0_seq1.p1  ORF type:complete len:392 (-),score=76.52 gnl/MRDRNA2_/MRDRNA2_112903_c0_seq1:76-1251(-)